MHDLTAKTLIAQMFDQFTDWRRGITTMGGEMLPDNVGMAFSMRISISNHGYEKDGNTHHEEWERNFHRHVHVIITTNHRVYVAVTQEQNMSDVDPKEFRNTSNHDSCWRTDGLDAIWSTIMEGYGECYDHVPDEHRRVPGMMSLFTEFGHGFITKEMFKFVRIERGDYVDDRHYFDTLKGIKELKFRVIVEETN